MSSLLSLRFTTFKRKNIIVVFVVVGVVVGVVFVVVGIVVIGGRHLLLPLLARFVQFSMIIHHEQVCFVGSSFCQLEARRFLKVALDAELSKDLSECENVSEPVLFWIERAFL